MKYGSFDGKQYEANHGSFFDRGSSDSYYGRIRTPHRGGVGGDSGARIVAETAEEITAYNAGYDWNEHFGDRKSWD